MKKNAIYFHFFLLVCVVFLIFFSVSPVMAASTGIGCDPNSSFGLIAEALCKLTGNKTGDAVKVGTLTNQLMSGIIGFLTVVAGLWFGLQMILGGYDWINSAGDKGKLETARNKIIYALLGIGIVVGAYVIIGLIGTLLGLQILNPGEIISNIVK